MSIGMFDCIANVKMLYRNFDANAENWDLAIRELVSEIDNVSNPDILERCIIEDENWEIPVDERILILRKAKDLGASSVEFFTDYYGYLLAHLDPGVEWDEAGKTGVRVEFLRFLVTPL